MTTVISASTHSEDPLRPVTAAEEDLRYKALVDESHRSSAGERYGELLSQISGLLPKSRRELAIELDFAVGERLVEAEDRAIDKIVITLVDRGDWPSFDRAWVPRRADPEAVPIWPASEDPGLERRITELEEQIRSLRQMSGIPRESDVTK